jgi:DNA invertase Pin-like site-specific DNA recombinase
MVDQRLSEATKQGMARARAEGRVPGRRTGVPVEVRERIRREHERGRSLRQIAAGLNRDQVPTGQGGATWWASTVRWVLRSGPSRAPQLSR